MSCSLTPNVTLSSVSVRPMVDGDLDAVVAIEQAAGRDPWSRNLFAQDFAEPTRCWFVALANTELVGFGGAMIVANDAHVMNIAVAPAYQRRGIGRQILGVVLNAAIRRGSTAATLEVRATNAPAIALYQQFGFVEGGKRAAYYRDGGDGLILWAHDLSSVGIGPTDPSETCS